MYSIVSILVLKNTRKDTHETRKLLFLQLEITRNPFLKFCTRKPHSAEMEALQNALFKPKAFMKVSLTF